MSIDMSTNHFKRAFMIFVIIGLTLVVMSCNRLSSSPFGAKTATPLSLLTPTLEECSWYGLMLAWNDSNGDGLQDANEPPLANIRFYSEYPSGTSDHGATGTGGSIGLVVLLPGCVHTQFEVYPEVPENCQLTTAPERMLADTRKENQEFSFGFFCH